MCLHPIEKAPIPYHTLHIDHLGPFVKSSKSNQYVIAIIDSFTKYVYLKAVRNASVRPVVNAIRELGMHFGTPSRIVSDRGSAFTSSRFKRFCKDYNIEHIKNATATPRANGQVEITNRTILRALRPMSDENDRKWDDHLINIQWSINSLPNDVTKQSPHQILFGFTPRPICNDKLKLSLFDEHAQRFEDDRENIRELVDSRIKSNQDKQKRRFDMKFDSPIRYKVGDPVVIFREPPSTGESRKLARKWRGPYTVTAVMYGDRYRVEDVISSDGRRRFRGVIPSDHMRLIVSPIDEEVYLNEDSSSEED